MNASLADQGRLLEIAELDARIAQAEQLRKNPPQAGRVQELLTRRQQVSQQLTVRLGGRDDLRAELARIESDVGVVEARRARDAARLQTVTNPKDAQGLESELASLARRKSDLEDGELEVMERLEQADAEVAELEGQVAEINAEGGRLSQEGKTIVADASQAWDSATRDRATVAGSLPGDLVALYDRLAVRNSGAAPLRRGTCEGCRMVLAGTDMAAIRQAASDAVLTCPECGCILVRTEESGL